MCKTSAADCKPLEDAEDENVHVEEDNVPEYMSEDESEFTDSDESYFTDSSIDNTDSSDTDAESASGNRVTPEMVAWLMLKERGLISEERYVQRPELCTANIRSLIPTIPRSKSWDSVHTGSGSRSEDFSDFGKDFKDEEKDEIPGEFGDKVENNYIGDTAEASNKNEVRSENKGIVDEQIVKEDARCDVFDIVKSENANNKLPDEDILVTQRETVSDIQNEANKDIEILEEEKAVIKTKQEELEEEMIETVSKQAEGKQNDNQEEQNVTCEKIFSSETTIAAANGDTNRISDTVLAFVNSVLNESEDNNIPSEKITNGVNENYSELNKENAVSLSDEYNNNKVMDKREDIELTKSINSKEESKSVKLASINESNGKKTKSFRHILKILVKEKRIIEEKESPISEGYGLGFVEVLKAFVGGLDYDYDENKAVDLFDDPDPDESLKSFALFLNFYSPSAYMYVTETFNTPLPDHRTLCSWYMKDNEQPGLSQKAFNILKQKSSKKRLTCVLMSCDIYLRNIGDYWYDQVDYGGGPVDDHMDKAVLVYVFILVSLDEDWKMPIGYIFARRIPAESQAELIRVCLTQCHEAGADVVAVTLEKPTPAEFLGCSFQDPRHLKTTFKHPTCDREVAVWIDPCMALKSARHTLKIKETLHDDKGDIIRWNLLRRLRRLHVNNTISFESPELLMLRNHIAKIGVTTETFSSSLAAALSCAEEQLPQTFRDTKPTRKYILYMNYLHDVLTSKPATSDISRYLNNAKHYLLGIFNNPDNELSLYDDDNLNFEKRLGYRFFMEGKTACGLIAFLICIESFKHLYTTLVTKEQRLDRLNPHRLCKVHAEDFVKNIRADTYLDPDDFTGDCFQGFYKRLFSVLEKIPDFTDLNVPMEQWSLGNRFPPAVTIKLTSGKRACDDVYSSQYALKRLRKTSRYDKATQLVREYSKALDTEMDMSAKKTMVGYLAGWIAARFARHLRCEACIDSLYTHKRLWFHKYITLKRLNRVCLPSKELFRICWDCEKALRERGSVAKLKCLVLRRLSPRLPWKRRWHPSGHHIHLARAVIAKYIPLRVKSPFSANENKRLVKLFRYSSSMAKDGLLDDIDELMNGSICSEEESDLY